MITDEQIAALTPAQLEQLAMERSRVDARARGTRRSRSIDPQYFTAQRSEMKERVAALLPAGAPVQARLAVEDALLGEFLLTAVPDFDDPTGLLEIMSKALTRPWRTVAG